MAARRMSADRWNTSALSIVVELSWNCLSWIRQIRRRAKNALPSVNQAREKPLNVPQRSYRPLGRGVRSCRRSQAS